MKLEFYSLKKQQPEFKIFFPLPTFFLAKDTNEKAEYGNAFVLFLFWGFGLQFKKTEKLKKYATCKIPLPQYLTRGREYEIIKTVGLSYVVKRDDGSIDKISQTRFDPPFEK